MESNGIFSNIDNDDSTATINTHYPVSTMETDDGFTEMITE